MSNNVKYSFIDAVLIERNELHRKYLCNAFAITEPTATRLIRAYKDLYPNNLLFDVSARCYRASKDFKPESLNKDITATEFLNAAQIMAEKNIFQEKQIT